jgi:hypothetical protein
MAACIRTGEAQYGIPRWSVFRLLQVAEFSARSWLQINWLVHTKPFPSFLLLNDLTINLKSLKLLDNRSAGPVLAIKLHSLHTTSIGIVRAVNRRVDNIQIALSKMLCFQLCDWCELRQGFPHESAGRTHNDR